MDDQNKNLILATALSFLVILVWFVLFPPPEPEAVPEPATISATDGEQVQTPEAPSGTTVGDATTDVAEALPEDNAPRVKIDTPRLSGSLSLTGGRIDELFLKDYKETIEEGSPIVELLSPVGSDSAYYALYGWAPGAGLTGTEVPGPNTMWALEQGETLDVDSPVTLAWDNGNGLIFRRMIAIDENYMFTVTQSVENTTQSEVGAAPYGIVARHGMGEKGELPGLKNFFILHEGVIGMADGTLSEIDYKDMREFDIDPVERAQAEVSQVKEDGWIGFTDHYWMTTLIPEPGSAFKAAAKYDARRKIYQTETVLPTLTVAPGETAQVSTRLFAGAKEWETIREYQSQGVQKFIDSIDWGWFFFLTKPIFWLLHNIHALVGNMGGRSSA